MYQYREEFSVARMAKVLDVSESGYYKWFSRIRSDIMTERKQEELELTGEICGIFRRSRGSYGIRKITAKVNCSSDRKINHKRVERIMRKHGLFSRGSAKFKCTTDSKHDNIIADNLLGRDFTASEPSEKMLSDTTVISTKEGLLYAAGIIDLYGRMPVGLAMSKTMTGFLSSMHLMTWSPVDVQRKAA